MVKINQLYRSVVDQDFVCTLNTVRLGPTGAHRRPAYSAKV